VRIAIGDFDGGRKEYSSTELGIAAIFKRGSAVNLADARCASLFRYGSTATSTVDRPKG
jgi:hypothetical protein